MKGKTVAKIRMENAEVTLDRFASFLGISSKTLRQWENSDDDIPIAIAHMIKLTYQESVFNDDLKHMTNDAFNTIPSEVVNIWLVDHSQCVLFTAGNRLAEVRISDGSNSVFERKRIRNIGTPTMQIPFNQHSLTTYPARTAVRLLLTGDEIKTHPEKRHKGIRSSIHFIGNLCENLIHVAGFIPGNTGPRPICILCLQNRLNQDSFKLSKDSYQDNEVDIAARLAEKYAKQLKPKFDELDMLTNL